MDVVEDLHKFDGINRLLTSGDVCFFGNACKSSCLKAVLVPSFVFGGLRGSMHFVLLGCHPAR